MNIGVPVTNGTSQPAVLLVVIGGVLSLLGSLTGVYFTAALTRRQRRRSVAGALAGEIGALVEIAATRKYVDGFDSLIAQTENTGQAMALGIVARHDYFSILNSHASLLGELPPALARDVMRFYVMTKSILEDGADAAEGNVKSHEALIRLQTTRALLVAALALGTDVTLRLTKVAEGK